LEISGKYFSCKENVGQKIRDSLAGASYHVIGHVSQVIQLEKTDLDRLLNSTKPHPEDVGNQPEKVTTTKKPENAFLFLANFHCNLVFQHTKFISGKRTSIWDQNRYT
jgi:hypothetical protein